LFAATSSAAVCPTAPEAAAQMPELMRRRISKSRARRARCRYEPTEHRINGRDLPAARLVRPRATRVGLGLERGSLDVRTSGG
jgi:hypothetical protein